MVRFGWLEIPRFALDGLLERVRGLRGAGDDVTSALRHVRRAPGFHALAMSVMALGIGATAAIMVVTDAVVFRPLPYERAEDLYLVGARFGDMTFSSNSLPNLRDVREMETGLEWIAGAHDWSPALTGAGEPVRTYALSVTRGYMTGLGSRARAGRLFTEGDYASGAEPVAVISWGLWQRAFGGDPSVVGRTIALDGVAQTVIGVMDRSWRDPGPIESGTVTQVWLPVRDDIEAGAARGDHSYQLIGRTRPGLPLAELTATLRSAGQRLSEAYPAENGINNSQLEFEPHSLKERTVHEAGGRLLLMLGAAALLLLLACANVANLFLARGHSRQVELTVRGVLGASRSRIAWQLFTESVVTTFIGGAAGVLVGVVGLRAFKALAPSAMPRLHEAQFDLRALALVVAVIVLTGIAFGLVPALRSSASGAMLRETRGTAGARRMRAQSAFVSVEIALALILATGSALLLRSFSALLSVDPGFDTTDVAVADIRPPGGANRQARQLFFDEVLRRSQGLAGVHSAALMYSAPAAGGGAWSRMSAEHAEASGETPFVQMLSVTEAALTTLRMRLRAGRDFPEGLTAGDAPVVILNETAARQIFPGVENPIGERLRFGPPGSDSPLREVIGVVADVKQNGPGSESSAHVYAPASQLAALRYSLVLRMAPGVAVPAEAIRFMVAEVGNGVPVDRIATMDELMAGRTAEARFLSSLLTSFALLALLLAAVGTYATASFAVARRLRELGIRMALGARAGELLGLVLRKALATASTGIVAGAAIGYFLSRFLESYLFGVGAHDPVAFAAAVTVIAAAATSASLIPALRAARVDPNQVLRTEA